MMFKAVKSDTFSFYNKSKEELYDALFIFVRLIGWVFRSADLLVG